MKIGGMHTCSLIDYPGKICTILFAQGCNFRCPYCHNPQLVAPELFTDPLQQERIFEFLRRRRGKLDAVTISGGEPTLQPGLVSFVRRVKALAFAVKLDTNGSRPEVLSELISKGLLDFIAMDLKAPLARYAEVVGTPVATEAIRESVRLIMASGVDYEFRTTWVPCLLSTDDLDAMMQEVHGAARYVIQRFVPERTLDPHFRCQTPLDSPSPERLAALAAPHVAACLVR
ncbi:MAG: anaerobic ribonucleoside-triphosphate reductase activating protein [Acidobacteria bacterium]|nr:anaerobic ribonucleoside-triphosphate reductase activating protein [Acidobacteriota bacterium]